MPRSRPAPTIPTIIEFATDPQLLNLSISLGQETLLRAIYGLPLPTKDHLDLWVQCTGRTTYPGRPFGEVTVIAGARSGKDSRIAAPIVCYEGLYGGHERHLAKGEVGTIPEVAQDLRATAIGFSYVKAYLTRSSLLSGKVAEVLAGEITLTNGLRVFCFPCTLRSLRGWSNPVGVMNEVGFYRLEGQADSDEEIQASIRRGMLSFPMPRLAKISTPYMMSGILYEDHKRAWGRDDPDLLVWQAPTVLMNPTITAGRLERERRLDASRFAREYEGEFVADVEAFLPAAWVEDAVIPGCHELAPRTGVIYQAAVDSSGGGPDAFTMSIMHLEAPGTEQARVVQDVLRSWGRVGAQAPNLAAVVGEIATILRAYGLYQATGDKYAAGWVTQAFGKAGISYIPAPMDKSTAYLESRALFAQGRIEILDDPVLVRQLKNLERRPRAGGRDQVDHPRGSRHHDDHANVTCLAAAILAAEGTGQDLPMPEGKLGRQGFYGPEGPKTLRDIAEPGASEVGRVDWDELRLLGW